MKKMLLCLIAVVCFSLALESAHKDFAFFSPVKPDLYKNGDETPSLDFIPWTSDFLKSNNEETPRQNSVQRIIYPIKPLNEIKKMLETYFPALRENIINHTMTILKCADREGVKHDHILTVIDFSLPSNEKRLWIFDLSENKLLLNTFVSHGIHSGELISSYFSNDGNSKASSLGVYLTDISYRGRHGLSLKLHGLDHNFNDNAYKRFIVIHGVWYLDENFIKKYGRPGRSWGCPAVSLDLIKPIIDIIREQSLVIAYYPNSAWLSESKFLVCDNYAKTDIKKFQEKIDSTENPEDIVYVDLKNHNKREENEPVLTISADDYHQIFKLQPPLTRMLRRQINYQEYIALNESELKKLVINKSLEKINFVIANVRLDHGYYVTELKVLPYHALKNIIFNNNSVDSLIFEGGKSLILRSTHQFIRWIGL